MELAHFTVDDSLALAKEMDLGVDRFSPDEIGRIAEIGNLIVGSLDQKELAGMGSRAQVASFVTAFAVAEQFPQLVQETSGLDDLDGIRTDDVALLDVLRELWELGVTDISDYVTSTEQLFSTTDDRTAELVSTLTTIKDQIVEDEASARGDLVKVDEDDLGSKNGHPYEDEAHYDDDEDYDDDDEDDDDEDYDDDDEDDDSREVPTGKVNEEEIEF